MSSDRHLSRRALLGLLGAGVIVGVSGGRQLLSRDDGAVAHRGPPAEPSRSTRAAPAAPPTGTPNPTPTTVPLAKFPPYEPIAGEIQPEAKVVAARVAEALTTYGPEDSVDATVGAALHHGAADVDAAAIVATAGPLFVAGFQSRGRVVYPQLGGLAPHADPRQCSIMVVVEQHLSRPEGEVVTSRCLDVRLRLVDGEWRLEGLADASDPPNERPTAVSDAVAAVLDHPGIWLPDSARWDIHEGLMDDGLLRELVVVADAAPIAVTTCRRGHPINVFGTGRRSAHMAGRAVDLWSVGDPVVQQHRDPGSLAHEVSMEIYRAGRVRNLGSPWAFDGAGGRTFTDPVHRDHLHLGF